MLDLFNEEFRQQAVGDEFDSVFVHLREELFGLVIDEAAVRQIDDGGNRCFAGFGAAPALFQFADASAREASFNKEADVAGDDSCGDA